MIKKQKAKNTAVEKSPSRPDVAVGIPGEAGIPVTHLTLEKDALEREIDRALMKTWRAGRKNGIWIGALSVLIVVLAMAIAALRIWG